MRTVLLAFLVVAALPARAAEHVLVFAAASTTDALQEVGKAFTKDQGVTVEFAFGASSDLARQAIAGAPADVFLSADTAKLEQVEKAGLVQAGTRVDLLSNRMVVVVPADSKLKVASAAELKGVKRLALADPAAVPAGIYAKAWMEKAGVWKELEPRVVPALDVRAALAAVEAGRVDAGVVLRHGRGDVEACAGGAHHSGGGGAAHRLPGGGPGQGQGHGGRPRLRELPAG